MLAVPPLGPQSVALAAPDLLPTRSPNGGPPELPTVTDGCVPPSGVRATATPPPLARLNPTLVWPLTRGEGVVVAVVDSGVSALARGLTDGAVLTGRGVAGRQRADRDCVGRGTALAGIVAARPVSGSAFLGIAPAAKILPIRIVDGDGRVAPGALAAGIRAATAAKADVILIGVGTPTADAELAAAVRAAIARDIVLVAPVADAKTSQSGGSGPVPAWYPARYEDVLAVGGVAGDGTPTEASSPESGVDLVAPVSGAVSLSPTGDGHFTVGGPAVAAAEVAGAAALVRAYHPDLDQAEVRRRLEGTAEPLPGRPGQAVGRGALDLYAAVTALEPDDAPVLMGSAPPVVLPTRPPTPSSTVIALATVVSTVVLAALTTVAVITVRWGRRRRWRP